MMDFIETLKSVGGVKPCPCKNDEQDDVVHAVDCHGTGQILDLAPLLANPHHLKDTAFALKEKLAEAVTVSEDGQRSSNCSLRDYGTKENRANCLIWEALSHQFSPYVIGPQRASNLVYETSRQLGGTAVVAIEDFKWEVVDTIDSGYEDIVQQMNHRGEMYRIGRKQSGYRLSLPIPPDATVLFVTDRLTKSDEEWVTAVLDSPSTGIPGVPLYETVKYLDYVLCLVADVSSFGIFCGPGHSPGKVISLHQEKS
jgi:hypothetical protein